MNFTWASNFGSVLKNLRGSVISRFYRADAGNVLTCSGRRCAAPTCEMNQSEFIPMVTRNWTNKKGEGRISSLTPQKSLGVCFNRTYDDGDVSDTCRSSRSCRSCHNRLPCRLSCHLSCRLSCHTDSCRNCYRNWASCFLCKMLE